MINLSPPALNEIKRLQMTREQFNQCVRLSVKTGGCSGLYYHLEFDQLPQGRDRVYSTQGITLVVDEQSHDYLQGLHLDYTEDLMGGGFRFHNPNATTHCGCGHSFAI